MRQFLLGTSEGTSLPLTAGQIALTVLEDGQNDIVSDASDIINTFYINLKRTSGDTVVLPCHKNHFSFEISRYQEGSVYSAEVTIPAPTYDGHFSLILAKKGTKFNERNRWTAVVPVKVGEEPAAIAAKLGKYFEANANNLNVQVVVADAKITITGLNKTDDFALIGADDLLGVAATETPAVAPINDAAYITDLANKAAADAGFVYTYQDLDINPGYPLNPLAQGDKADTGFKVFTLRFAVPRQVKTRDEVVHQIVQLAFPDNADTSSIEVVFGKLAGKPASLES